MLYRQIHLVNVANSLPERSRNPLSGYGFEYLAMSSFMFFLTWMQMYVWDGIFSFELFALHVIIHFLNLFWRNPCD